MKRHISGKVALVTGANRGIGKAIVEAFLRKGAEKVYLAVRDVSTTSALEAQFGDRVQTIRLDLRDDASVKAAAMLTGDVDIVVNNAGVLVHADALSEEAVDELSDQMEVNVYGLLRLASAFKHTLISNQGALVQLNSVASIKNFGTISTYSASKAAAYSITQDLRQQFAQKNVLVVSVHPGPIATDMAQQAGFYEVGDPPEMVAQGIIEALAQGEFHLFPDTMAKEFAATYRTYSDLVIEPLSTE